MLEAVKNSCTSKAWYSSASGVHGVSVVTHSKGSSKGKVDRAGEIEGLELNWSFLLVLNNLKVECSIFKAQTSEFDAQIEKLSVSDCNTVIIFHPSPLAPHSRGDRRNELCEFQ